MNQINTFSRSKLRNNELLTFYREVEESIRGNQSADKLNIEALYTAYTTAVQTYADAIVNVSKSALTEQIEAADQQRDSLFVGICETIRTGTRHFKPATAQAAKNLMPVVDVYAGAATKSIDDETSYLNNFMAELNAEKHTADISALGLAEWIENLETANLNVARLSMQRTNEQLATGTSTGAGMRTRTEADNAYDQMTQMLNALCLVNGPEKYQTTFDFINARIKHYQDMLAQRKGKAEAEKK